MGPTDPNDPNVLRVVRIGTPPAPSAPDDRYTLWTWDTNKRFATGQCRVGRRLVAPNGMAIFEDEECGIAPHAAIDSDDALEQVLGWCVLKPGDTDADFFADYTPDQIAFAESAACEMLALAVYDYENAEQGAASYADSPDAVEAIVLKCKRIFHDVHACHDCGADPNKPAPRYCNDPWRHAA